MRIDTVHFKNIRPADWRTTHILKPDLKLLGESLVIDGWTAPIVVRQEDSTIIDGFSRWIVAQGNKKVLARDNGKIPVLWMDVDEIDARVAHIRLNRAKGMIVPRFLSLAIKDVLKSKKYDERELMDALNMGVDEFRLLRGGNLFKSRNIAEHEYSKAWIPVESNGRDVPTFERPPTPDG